MLELKGRVEDSYIETAQSSVCNARQQSIVAAFNLFKTELSTDQALHRKEMAACTGDFERHYSQLLCTLEARQAAFCKLLVSNLAVSLGSMCSMGLFAQGFHEASWRLVAQFAEEGFPVWTIPTKMLSAQLPAKLKPWQAAVVQSVNAGIRRPENENYIYWLNMVTCGITSAVKTDWFLSFLTQVLTDQPTNSIAIILHSNRAAQIKGKKAQDQKMKTERGALIC